MVFLQRQVRLHRILHSSVQELLGDSLMEVSGWGIFAGLQKGAVKEDHG